MLRINNASWLARVFAENMGWDPAKIEGQVDPTISFMGDFSDADARGEFRPPATLPPDPQGAPRNITPPKVEGL